MSGREALTAERLASARAQAESALAGCAFCGRPHKDPDTAMHAPVPYVLEVPASEMLELLDEAAAAREALAGLDAFKVHVDTLRAAIRSVRPSTGYKDEAIVIAAAEVLADMLARRAQRGGEG